MSDQTLPPTLQSDDGAREEPAAQTHEELERVREIILGPDPMRQRLRKAETDRLRDILFGAQIEDYERRFTDVRREVERTRSELTETRERLTEVEKSVARRFELLEMEFRRLAEELRRESERGRSRDALLQQLATQVRAHEETLVGATEGVLDLRRSHALHEADIRAGKSAQIEIRDQLEQRTHTLRREVRQSEETVRGELRRIADRLENQKTDRKALASMLLEIATRLETGNSVTGLLEGLSGPKE
jgi:chromosome segregation ATPase